MDTPEQEPAPATKRPGRRRKIVDSKKLTLQWLAERGFLAQDVETRIPHTFITRDLFGIGDILAIRDGHVLLIQACVGGGDPGRHIRKIRANPKFPVVAAAMPVVLFAWRRVASKFGPPQLRPRKIHLRPDAMNPVDREPGVE